mgnify:CR=1 FL=1
MKERIIYAIILSALVLPIWAQQIDETEARQRAEAFLEQRGKALHAPALRKAAKSRGTTGGDADGAAVYYLFNVGSNEGFVIVSGDDRAAAILGYADSGSISEDDMPDGLRYMLDGYAEEVAALRDTDIGHDRRQPRRSASVRTAIAPLVTTQWDQDAPYWNLCPAIGGTQCVTGCVATAMAQVMRYHQWPTAATTAIPGYTSRNGKHTLEALDATTFDWANMTATYSTSATDTPADAVAKLMQYCGWALQMNYNTNSAGGSSAYNVSIAEALKAYFGYDGSVTYAQRQHYTYQEWVSMVYGELASRRPVILGGQATGSGHSFVCDGYDTDDYFHINWGWSGSSDGYFRLSALNPSEQGIGGSSTLDGFSFTQDAVIGIRPYTSTTAAACLSVEKMQFDATGTTATQTVSRDNSGDAFTGISLYLCLCSFLFDTNSFDYAVNLVDGSGRTLATLHEVSNQSMTFNTDAVVSLSSLSTPAALADGTYYIKVVSRLNGESVWQECYDGLQQQITATVSGNTLTLTAPIVSGTASLPTAVSFSVSGNQTKGYEQEVIASVTGSTVADYYGNLVLRVNGTSVMGKSVEIPCGQTVDVRFTYIPTTSGSNTLALYTSKSGDTQIGSDGAVAIAESDATSNLDLTFSYTIDNQTSDEQLYANAFRATVTVGNSSAVNSYVGQLNCSTRKWTDNGDGTWGWVSLGITRYPLTVGKNSSTIVHVAADDLPSDELYSFRLTYQRVTESSTIADAVHIGLTGEGDAAHGTLTVTSGYALGDALGTRTAYPAADVINAGDACFADLRGLASFDGVTVTTSTNPNCLYLIAEGATAPSSLTGCNVVCGTTAASLSLTDGHDFYSPIDFTATTATYTRTFTQAAAGTSGWSTLCIPFTVSTVTVNGTRTATWFTSDDDEKGSFWLRAFVDDGKGTVGFSHAQSLLADTPYIIAVPGDTWGDAWQMTGRTVTFSATGAAVSATATASASGNYYKFCGTTVGTNVTDGYVLNDSGSKFVKKTEATAVAAFRAWFVPVSISSLTLPSLTIAAPTANAIHAVRTDDGTATATDNWYTVDGRRLAGKPTVKGIYIYRNKKIVIK